MSIKKIFVSYSRKEFYFSESLATTLKTEYGLAAWFDIHELQVGTDWSASIHEGLSNCDALILVASKASLASPYVRAEWQAALDNKKPIFIAIFEPVELPETLRGAVCVDMRGNFKPAVKRLVKAFDAPTIPVDTMPKNSPLSMRFPNTLWLIILTLIFPIAFIYDLRLYSVPIIIFVLVLLRGFLRRQYDHSSLRSAFGVAIAGSALIFAVSIDRQMTSLTVLCVIFALLAGVCFWLMNTSAAVLRWSPTGQAPQALRERINKAVRRTSKPQFSALSKTYRLHHVKADAGIAKAVKKHMDAAFYSEATDTNADHQIIIVSNKATTELIQQANALSGKLVTVVGSAFVLPTDARELSKYQWIDYRSRDNQALLNMVEDVYIDDTDALNAHYAFKPVPEGFSRSVLPSSVEVLVEGLNIVGWFGVISALIGIFIAITNPPSDMFGVVPFSPLFNSLYAICSSLLLLLSSKIRHREIGVVSAVLFTLVVISLNAFAAYQMGAFSPTSDVVFCGNPLLLLAAFSSFRQLANWLPTTAAEQKAQGYLNTPDPQRMRRRVIFGVLVALLIVGNFVAPRLIN